MKKLRKVLTLAAALFVMMAAVCRMNVPVEAYVQKLGTITSDTSLYESASSSASVVMSLTSGQSVLVNNEVTGTDGAIWYQLYVDNTETGYVLSSVVSVSESSSETGSTEAAVLTTTTTTTVTTGTITAGTVNVRASATTSSTAVTTLSSGDTFTVVAEETGDDGYVWYQAEFEQNGSTVTGYIRSDLATVSTEEIETVVENPDVTEESAEETTETAVPYRLVSQESAEGETIWYLVEDGSSEGYSVEALLEAANTPVSSSGGGQKAVIVLLIILLIIAGAAAAFFCLRWRDAENLMEEMREQNKRRRTVRKEAAPAAGGKSQNPQSRQAKPQQSTAGQTRSQQSAPGQARPQQSTSGQARPQQSATGQTKTQQSVQARTQQTVKAKPAAGGGSQTSSKPVAPTLTKGTRAEASGTADTKPKTRPQPRTQSKSSYDDLDLSDLDDLDLEDFPSSDDIVQTTRKELTRKQEEPVSKPKTRKSRNFLDDDDDEDLEFDFLRLDDDDE